MAAYGAEEERERARLRALYREYGLGSSSDEESEDLDGARGNSDDDWEAQPRTETQRQAYREHMARRGYYNSTSSTDDDSSGGYSTDEPLIPLTDNDVTESFSSIPSDDDEDGGPYRPRHWFDEDVTTGTDEMEPYTRQPMDDWEVEETRNRNLAIERRDQKRAWAQRNRNYLASRTPAQRATAWREYLQQHRTPIQINQSLARRNAAFHRAVRQNNAAAVVALAPHVRF